MKFSINRLALLEALTVTGKCVASVAIIPALTHYRFNIDKDKLEITGGNMEVFLTQVLEITGGDFAKSIAIPSARLVTIIKDFPDSIVQFELEKTSLIKGKQNWNVIIFCTRCRYVFPLEDGNDYPSIRLDDEQALDVKSADLFEGIEKTIFACHNDITNKLSGINIRVKEGGLVFTAATDAGLATRTFDIAAACADVSVTIPSKTMSILKSTPCDDVVKVLIRPNSVRFLLSENTILDSMIFTDSYPDLSGIIPQENTTIASASSKSLLGAVKRVSAFSNPMQPELIFEFDGNTLIIKTSNDFGESAKEEVALTNYNDGPYRIALNGGQLGKILSRIDTVDVELLMGQPEKAIIVANAGTDIALRRDLMLTSPHFLPQ